MVLTNFYYLTNIFDLHVFDNETAALLIFFEICTDMHIVSLFCLNKRNITTSCLMIHLKCPFSKIRQKCPNLEKKCPNFGYLLVKFPGKKTGDFFPAGPFFQVLQLNVYQSALISSNSPALKNSWLRACSRYSILQNIMISNLVILKCDTTVKFEKMAPFLQIQNTYF